MAVNLNSQMLMASTRFPKWSVPVEVPSFDMSPGATMSGERTRIAYAVAKALSTH